EANAPLGGIYQNEIQHLRTWMLNRAGWMDRRRIDGGLLPVPPIIEGEEGSVTVGFGSSAEGVIYFTTDGTDPRASGGAPRGRVYAEPIPVNGPTTLTGRVLDAGGNWSTPATASFGVSDPPDEATTLHYWSFNATTLA